MTTVLNAFRRKWIVLSAILLAVSLVAAQDVVKGLVLLVALVFSFTLSHKKHRHVAPVPL